MDELNKRQKRYDVTQEMKLRTPKQRQIKFRKEKYWEREKWDIWQKTSPMKITIAL